MLDDGTTAWGHTIDLGIDFATADHRGGNLQGEQLHSDSSSSCRGDDTSSGLNDEQNAGFGPSLSFALQPSRPHIGSSVVSNVKTEQLMRRREQNKRCQQAYRERRTLYISNLESKVEKMDDRIRILQIENRELLRRLCEVRAENNVLRSSRSESEESRDAQAIAELVRSLERPKPCVHLSEEELELLYEPFSAVWNLSASHLPSGSGVKAIAAVIERLQTMATEKAETCVRSEATDAIEGG